MPSSQIRTVIGSAVTAAVLFYSYPNSPSLNQIPNVTDDIQLSAPDGIKYDYYELINKDHAAGLENIDIMHKFASNILDNIKDLDPEFSKTVDDNFWDLI